MQIIVASKNPVKLNAVREGFKKMFPEETFGFEGVDAASGVSNQPLSDEETYRGAWNRASHAAEIQKDGDYWVGIEGGLEEKNGEMEVFAWVVIRSREGKYGKGKSATFFLPHRVAELVRQGKELGDASDAIFQEKNVKQKQGTIGILTLNNINRTKYYIDPVIIALIPFRNLEIY